MRRLGVLAGVAIAAGLGWWWLAGGPAHQGYSVAPPAACAATSSAIPFPAPARPGLDRFVLPVGPVPVAPVRATVCRYAAGGRLAGALELDPARTAVLAAAVAEPLTGWPDDALLAKHPPALTDAQLDAARPPGCSPDGSAVVLTFAYPQGPPVVVRVREGPCADLTNGTISLRTPPAVADSLAALPRLG